MPKTKDEDAETQDEEEAIKNFDHSFSNKHHQQLKLLVIHGHLDCPLVSIVTTEEEDIKDETRTFCDPDFGSPVASCHELVLMVDGEMCDDEKLALCNPTTKDPTTKDTWKTLPPPLRPPPSAQVECRVVFYGFGLDPKSNDDDDYKVIRYLELVYKYDNYDTAAGFMGYEVAELYSLKTDSWRRIPYPHDNTPGLDPPIYINGFNYWVVPTGPGCEDVGIVSFDFAKESFPCALIPGPPPYKFDERHHFLVAEYEGSLALVAFDMHEKQQLELWVCNFDDNRFSSWSSVGVWEVVGVDIFSPLAFLKNRFFYFGDSDGELVVFDVATQKLKWKHGFCAVQPLYLIVCPFRTRTTLGL